MLKLEFKVCLSKNYSEIYILNEFSPYNLSTNEHKVLFMSIMLDIILRA